MEVKVIGGLPDDTIIWRYMSIDKFINLLEDSSLFFSPLSYYEKTDPFEGYPPPKMIEMLYSVQDSFYEKMQENIDYFDAHAQSQSHNHDFINRLQELKKQLSMRSLEFRKRYTVVTKGTLVNCWHASPYESEAMWKLYGESHKGLAIRTTVGKLRKALEGADSLSWVSKMFVGRVKYLDYADPAITAKDCLVDGFMSPLLKRISFAHEKEVRAFFVSGVSYKTLDEFKPAPYEMKINVARMLDGVHISPYVDVSYGKAIRAVYRAYGLDCELVESSLLMSEAALYGFLNKT